MDVHPWLKRSVFGAFRRQTSIILLMQQICFIRFRFVDFGRPLEYLADPALSVNSLSK